jgi:hypothetical protein
VTRSRNNVCKSKICFPLIVSNNKCINDESESEQESITEISSKEKEGNGNTAFNKVEPSNWQ